MLEILSRSYTFHVAGHLMLRPAPISLDESDIPDDAPFKPFIERGTTDQLSSSRSFSLQLVGGAGGLQDKHGDYLYQDQKLARSVEGGAWGILRVQPADFDPVKAAKYLLDDISYSKNIPSDIKPILIEETQKILDNLLSYDQAKVKEICEDIIPSLLKFLSEYDKLKDTDGKGYASDYNTYDDSYGSYAENEDEEGYGGEKDSYDNDEYNDDDTLTFEKLAEELRNIAYAIC